jgi:hypothetical protein
MINAETNKSDYEKTKLNRFVPLTKGDSPEPSGQGVFLKAASLLFLILSFLVSFMPLTQ